MTADLRVSQAKLIEEQRRTQQLIEVMPIPVYFKATDGRYLGVNKAWETFFGVPRQAFLGKTVHDLYPGNPVLAQRLHEDDQALWDHPGSRSFEMTITTADGEIHNTLFYKATFAGADGCIAGLIGTIVDITERKRTEQEIETLADVGRIISSTSDIDEVYDRFAETVRKIIPFDRIVINHIDVEMNTVINVYMAGHEITDRKVGVSYPLKGSGNFEMVRTRSSFLIQTEDFDECKDRFSMLLSTFQAGFRSIMNIPLFSKGEIIGGLLLRSFKPYAYTDRDVRLAERVGNQIAGTIANSQLFTGLKKAEQELKESEQKYRELSIIDDLTQLYNPRHFYFQLKIELDRSNRYEQPLTLLLLDLDNFKAFNDAYGHVEGDQVLKRLGQVVKRCLRETDFAYRYGGEEFTIILPMTTSADGIVTAERIRTEFKKEAFSPAPDQEVHVTVSIGLAQYKPQEEMKAFVHRVDQLMYQGKKNGKDRVCCKS
jgi:diguanylate cyclase (GGDEF)-like protein/PAS domain S-box-containing protein